ncbi:Transposon TX1 uncharacterized protein [Glycine max]|nr:Transposon TX1 uncharacterized protein [Glycine max]
MESIDRRLCQYLWADCNASSECAPSINGVGGLLCIWNNDSFSVDRKVVGRGFILLEGMWIKENKRVSIINVYAPCDLQGKRQQWDEILQLKTSSQEGLWCVLGDFNSIRHQDERVSSAQSVGPDPSISEFNSWISYMALEEVRSVGRRFTWCRLNGSAMSRLDRFLLSDEWLVQWPGSTQFVLDRDYSDHCPILLKSKTIDWGPKPFKVMDWWLKDKGFQQLVEQQWGQLSPSWMGRKVQNIKMELNALEAGLNDRTLSQEEVILKKSLQVQLWDAAYAYGSMLRQKTRVKWLKEGDNNFTYFHRLINHRRRKKNAIQGISIDGVWVHEPCSVKNVAILYFKDRFSEECCSRPTLDGVQFSSLDLRDKESLVSRFSELEIKSAVWDCGGDKSPGPDGLNFNFINHFCEILKPDFISLWKDKWLGDNLNLQAKYLTLYLISNQQTSSINSMRDFVEDRWEWKLIWRRNFFDHEIDMVAAFLAEIESEHIHQSSRDFLCWKADPNGLYSTKSAYKVLQEAHNNANEDKASKIIWSLKIPPRASAFSWRLFNNMLVLNHL